MYERNMFHERNELYNIKLNLKINIFLKTYGFFFFFFF